MSYNSIDLKKTCEKKSAQYRMVFLFSFLSLPSAWASMNTQTPSAIKLFILGCFIGLGMFCYYKSKKWSKTIETLSEAKFNRNK